MVMGRLAVLGGRCEAFIPDVGAVGRAPVGRMTGRAAGRTAPGRAGTG